jgi:hypothetical protein
MVTWSGEPPVRSVGRSVGRGDRVHDVLVEPLTVRVVGRAAADVLGEAAGGVGLRGRQRGGVTDRGGVADVDLTARLVGDGGQPGLDVGGVAVADLVEAVGGLGVGEGDLRQGDRAVPS